MEEPEPEPEPDWDPYAGCRGTSACENAPGGFATWEDYDQANNPDYYEGWGEVPEGFINWTGFTEAVESGEVSAEVAGEELPEFVVEEGIVEVYVAPVYVPTVTMTNIAVALQETLSTSVITTQTGTATSSEVTDAEVTGTEVSTDMTAVLSRDANDGHWHTWETTVTTTETTTETTTATTVTNTLVDTTSVVARTGVAFVSCTYVDGIESGCSTQQSWDDPTTTATAGDAYTQAATTSATADVVTSASTSASEQVEQGCSEGGWTGMGDWCIVSSGSRSDYDYIQFSLEETTNVRIDAETNLTYQQFVAGNHEYGDPYIYLNEDNNSAEGNHSGDASAVTVGSSIESDDDGGRDCNPTSACINPPSNATDPDETPHVIRCENAGTDCSGWPDLPAVIDNVSDVWDSEIVRINLEEGDYVVRASVYNSSHDGWYRLTIEEDD